MPIFPPSGAGLITPGSFLPLSQTTEFWASPTGSDTTGDGLTPASAFQSAGRACAAANAAGGGRVKIINGSWANAVSGAGLWIQGPNDTGNGGPGWIPVNHPLDIEIVPNLGGVFTGAAGSFVPGGGASDWAVGGSPLWITGSVSGLTFRNMYFSYYASQTRPGPSLRIGLSSPVTNVWSISTTYAAGDNVNVGGVVYESRGNGNVGHEPTVSPSQWKPFRAAIVDGLSPSLTAMVRFRGCGFASAGATGPVTVDIGSGFWYWFDDCGFSRSSNGDRNQLTHAGVRIYSDEGISNYFTYFNNCIFGGMGIYSYGANGTTMAHCQSENQEMPVWHGVKNNVGDSPGGSFEDVRIADAIGTSIALQNDGDVTIEADSCDEVTGPAYIRNAWTQPAYPIAERREYGQNGELLEARTMAPGLLGSPTASRYRNIANSFALNPGGTFQIGPHGEPASAALAKLGFTEPMSIYSETGDSAPAAVGDYYAWGMWFNPTIDANHTGATVHNGGTDDMTVTGSMGTTVLAAGSTTHKDWFPSVPVSLNRWTYISGWCRIVAVGASHTFVISYQPPDNYIGALAWCYHIPAAAGETDASVAEMAQTHFGSPSVATAYPNVAGAAPATPDPGTISIYPGLKMAFYDATLAAWKYLDIDNGIVRIT